MTDTSSSPVPKDNVQIIYFDWDVLVAILPFTITGISPGDHRSYRGIDRDLTGLSTLMKTCRTLHAAGVPLILQGKIQLPYDLPGIFSFCDFILRHPRRAEHVRWLEVPDILVTSSEYGGGDVDNPLIPTKRLVKTLKLLRNLKRLHLSATEGFLRLDGRPGISNAIASLPNVEHIQFLRMSSTTGEKLLKSMRSPISVVCLRWMVDIVIPPDPESLLAPHAQHLTNINLIHPPSFRFNLGIRFPLVHTLRLDWFDEFIEVGRLCRAFPHLKTFRWITDELEPDSVQEESQRAISRQHAQSPVMLQWKLDVLSCGVGKAYTAFGFIRPVRVWEVVNLFPHRLSQYHTVLRDLQPTFLHLGVCHLDGYLSTGIDLFPSVSSITHLNVKLESILEEAQGFLKYLRRHIGMLSSLKFFSLTVYKSARNGNIDVRKYVQEIAAELPRLAFASTAFNFEQESDRLYWKIVRRPSSGLAIEDVHEDVGRDVLLATPFTYQDMRK